MFAKKWVLVKEFQGMPKVSDFKVVEEPIPNILEQGEILCKAEWMSVDPYMRGAGTTLPLLTGGVMPGGQVARVIKSRHENYPEGTHVIGYFGWRDLTVFKPDFSKSPAYFYKLPDLKGLPVSYALGALGMPGNTAYFGVEKILEISSEQPGTIVVTTAAGAVGSIVCQIAKMKGCKILAFTGSSEKTHWLKQIGAGYIFDYNLVDVDATLTEYAPEGVDYFWDNVGGEFSYHVMRHMKEHGRIAVCGAFSVYNQDLASRQRTMIPFDYIGFIYKKLRMEGFLVSEWENEWQEGLEQLIQWVSERKVMVEETVLDGFDHMPQAFRNIFLGKNIGKQVVKV